METKKPAKTYPNPELLLRKKFIPKEAPARSKRKNGWTKRNHLKNLFVKKVNDNSEKMVISVFGSEFYILNKKITIKVFETLNAGSFQPVERILDKTMIITAIVVFCGKEGFNSYAAHSVVLKPLIKMKCPVIYVEKEEDIVEAVEFLY